jgi:hypothetical protein
VAALCVYGIVRAEAQAPPPPAGVEGRPVTRVAAGPLAALVSDAPDGPVKASRRNLMAHSGVLQSAVAATCVLPMRFGIVMPSADAVEHELLREHESRLLAQLDAFEDLVELDLKVLCPEEDLLRAVMAERPEIAQLRERLSGQAPEATYYERIRLGELVAGAVAAKRDELVRRVVERIEPLTVETAVGEPAHDDMLVNCAFLAQRTRVKEVDAAVDALGAELGESMRVKYVGPLPPHHFVDTGTGAESTSWA